MKRSPAETSLPLRFEEASRGDFPEIIRLARTIWPGAYARIISAEQIAYMLAKDYTPERLQSEQDAGIRFVLVVLDGVRIGFLAYGPSEREGEAELHKVYLLAEQQGKGLGSAMLREIQRRVTLEGYRALSLCVNRRNDKALRAYLRNGFRKRAEVVTEIGHGFVRDDFVLVWTLDPPCG